MKRPNTTTVLLAVVAVLLGLNLCHGQARAQPNPQVEVPEHVVGMMTVEGNAWRIWTDGVIEVRKWTHVNNCNDGLPYWTNNTPGGSWHEITFCNP